MPPLEAGSSGTWLGESFTFYGDHVEWCRAMAAHVLWAVARATGFSLDELSERGRRARVASARKAAIWLLIEVAEMTFSATGRLLGRDHSTIMFAHREALKDYASRWVIESVLAGRGSFEVVEPAHGGVVLL
jgi:hypothetical protein